ncbi:unnamed protein product [Symbiodinium sp. CCMP2592]|nr:unnamed protein product [Symbiodinium sp. CCMP2592]
MAWLFLGRMALLALCSGQDDVSRPHFKWGQTKEKVFVTVAVRNLNRSSISVHFAADRLGFQCSDIDGKAFALGLELDQDVAPDLSRWELLSRKERWGEPVLMTLTKIFPAAWPALVHDPQNYRQVMDRDWSRNDDKLETAEDAFFEEHAEYLPQLATETDVDRFTRLSGVEAVVVLARHHACEQCGVADTTFAAAAKKTAAGAKEASPPLLLFAMDVRSRAARPLARRLGLRCPEAPRDCRYLAFSRNGGLEPVLLRGRHDEAALSKSLELLSRKQFFELADPEEAREMRAASTRSLVILRSDATTWERQAVHQQRMKLDIGILQASADSDFHGRALAFRPGEDQPRHFNEGSAEEFRAWLLNVSVPCLGDVREFADEEPYEDVGLPIAKLFLKGGGLDTAARSAMFQLCSRFFGRMAFTVRNASLGSSDWRQHGIPPGRFPAFAVAMSTAYNTPRFGFLGIPKNQTEEFWMSPARQLLIDFVEAVLRGGVLPSRMSEAPPDEEDEEPPKPGSVQKLVGRRCRQLVEDSTSEALIEGFDEWRRDHADRSRRLDLLAPLLMSHNISVYRLDFGQNECPPDVLRSISAGYSGYFFVHPHARQRGRKLQRLRKLDPDFGQVLQFVQKHSHAELGASDLLAALESAIAADSATTAGVFSWSVASLSILLGACGAATHWKFRG